MPVRRHGRTWEARVQSAGKRLSRTFASRPDALEWERHARRRIADHRVGRTPAYSLEEAIERWLTGEAASLRSHRHLLNIVAVVYPLIRGRALTDVVEVAEAIKAAGIDVKAAPATVNRKLAVLRRVARLAHRQWQWLDEPLGDRITLVPGERHRHTYLTTAQVQKLALAAPKRIRDAILLAALTGLRRSEILRLKAADKRGGMLTLSETKSGRPRIVPLPPQAAHIKLPLEMGESELRVGFEAARAKAGMPHVRFHDLRHTYASWLVRKGAGLTVVRDLLGHASLSVTSRYAHLQEDQLRAAVKGLPRLAGIRRGRKKAA